MARRIRRRAANRLTRAEWRQLVLMLLALLAVAAVGIYLAVNFRE